MLPPLPPRKSYDDITKDSLVYALFLNPLMNVDPLDNSNDEPPTLKTITARLKHLPGKHDQSAHGKPGRAGSAFRGAYSAARAGGAGHVEARNQAKTAAEEVRQTIRDERRAATTPTRAVTPTTPTARDVELAIQKRLGNYQETGPGKAGARSTLIDFFNQARDTFKKEESMFTGTRKTQIEDINKRLIELELRGMEGTVDPYVYTDIRKSLRYDKMILKYALEDEKRAAQAATTKADDSVNGTPRKYGARAGEVIAARKRTVLIGQSGTSTKASDGYAPPDGVRAQAKRGLELRREFGRGGTSIGVARARDLSNGKRLSDSTIMRMVSFFARHAVDKRPDWSNPSKPTNGYIAHLLWGGDAGKSWADKISRQIKSERTKEAPPKKYTARAGEVIAGNLGRDSSGQFARVGENLSTVIGGAISRGFAKGRAGKRKPKGGAAAPTQKLQARADTGAAGMDTLGYDASDWEYIAGDKPQDANDPQFARLIEQGLMDNVGGKAYPSALGRRVATATGAGNVDKAKEMIARATARRDAIQARRDAIQARRDKTTTKANKPNNPGLWAKAIAQAKRKFEVYPSAYANGWAAKWYKSKGGTWSTKKDLRQWFNAKWVNIAKPIRENGKIVGYQPCGRQDGKGAYPKCMPLSKAMKLSDTARATLIKRKRETGLPVGGVPTMTSSTIKHRPGVD